MLILQLLQMAYLDRQFLAQFWDYVMGERTSSKNHILTHRALPVKEWLHLLNVDSLCVSCQLASETIQHCIWDCHLAIQVWL